MTAHTRGADRRTRLAHPGSHHERLSIMTVTWSPDELARIGSAEELEIAVRRADGTLRRWVPIWVVCVGQQVYVRTWHRRETGWFGQVLLSCRARIRVPGVEADVAVADVGEGAAQLRAAIDAAYRTKYGRYGSSSVDAMVGAAAAAATLLIRPERGASPTG
jgi:hypothetical protein